MSFTTEAMAGWLERVIEASNNDDADVTVAGSTGTGSLIVVTRDYFPYGARTTQAWKITVEAL